MSGGLNARHSPFPASWQRLAPLLGLACLWQVLSLTLDNASMPSPAAVLVTLYREITEGELLLHLGNTLMRVGAGFGLAMFAGVGLGMLMGRSARWDRPLDGVLILGLNTPALVVIILCYVWFGLTETAAVLAVTFNKLPCVAVSIREGARAMDQKLLDVARVYRLSRRDTFFRIYLPQLYPYLFGAARNGLSMIWKIVLVVELLGRSDGIGFRLGSLFHFFDIAGILAYTMAFMLVIFSIEALLLRPLESRLNRWRA
jgi:ABC-type nitrate/sulfonate/bicarbonate transport system permease component